MKIFDAASTAAALPYSELVPALVEVAQQLREGKINAPERMVVEIDPASVLLCMPAVAADIGMTKLITVHANNAQYQLPAIQGEVVVFDAASGRRLALLHGPTVTARRTAAVSLLGIEALLPVKPKSALLIGTGVQAIAHADGLIDYFGVGEFWVSARDLHKTQAFCDALQLRHPQITVKPLAAAALASDVPPVDVMIALTTSRSAVIPVNIAANTLAIGVGAFKPDMVEFPAELLHSRTVVVDCLAGAKHEAGDLLQAKIDWDKVRELPDVLAQGFVQQPLLPVYKTVGQAAWDLAAARVAIASLAG
ncbi:ornithine cyclodeaminase/mu-crystallin family protein [Collimonas arenae]|uniref:Ornithine cyclodeaminase/mu-crystallin family protein n=1 Tax=Collimonas arenae TaxID=279058 RepID=A0A127QMP6_9BURK|nr:delta(1)-pyrroline-2-carboxylate reductase family protein [Collimonas arenae]AMP01367.1 ornithine cyclodeaminase/mu-crystallin family protein [Collimonas arenae]AMP11266.1 ornithine cyclodeaminase/mu-crystallin family protein [Collimonas arenae]